MNKRSAETELELEVEKRQKEMELETKTSAETEMNSQEVDGVKDEGGSICTIHHHVQ